MGGGPWNNTRGHSLCLQVEVVVAGGPWNNTRGRSLCLQVGVVVGGVSCFYSFGEPLTDGLTQCLCIDRTLLYS